MKNRFSRVVLMTSIPLLLVCGAFVLEGWLHGAASSSLLQPSLPMRFYGNVTIEGQNVMTGTLLSASISGTVYATAVITLLEDVSAYVIDVPGDDPGTSKIDGGRNGDTVVFKIPGYTATQTGEWRFGGAEELNLALVPDPKPKAENPVSIPEPVTMILFGAGLGILSTVRVLSQRTRR